MNVRPGKHGPEACKTGTTRSNGRSGRGVNVKSAQWGLRPRSSLDTPPNHGLVG